jgi:hypothetical protein
MSSNDDGDDEVGYGKPPVDKQFKKGVSGNPKGRPKGTPNGVQLRKEARRRLFTEKIEVVEGGRRKKVTLETALNGTLLKKAAQGDLNAMELEAKRVAKAEKRAAAVAEEEEVPQGCLLIPRQPIRSIENFVKFYQVHVADYQARLEAEWKAKERNPR